MFRPIAFQSKAISPSFFEIADAWSLLLLLLCKKIKFSLWQNPVVRFSALFILFNLWVYWPKGHPKIRSVYMFLPFACTILGVVYQRYEEAFPEYPNRLLRYLAVFFGLVLMGVLVLPFLTSVSLLRVVALSVMLSLFLWTYLHFPVARIRQLIAGVMLLHHVYAALLIPLQHSALPGDRQPVAVAVKVVKFASLQYAGKAVLFPVAIRNLLFSDQADRVVIPPGISYQIPYWLHTGKIMTYDSTPHPATAFFPMPRKRIRKLLIQCFVFSMAVGMSRSFSTNEKKR